MKAPIRIALLAAAAAFGAGCADQPLGTMESATFHARPAAEARYDLAFQPVTAALLPGEAERLAAFLQGLGLVRGDDVHMTFVASGSPDLDRRRVAAASAAVRAAGTPAGVLVVHGREGDRLDGRHDIVLIEPLRRGQLLVACPPRYADAYEEAYAARIPPLGCANAANLAHMAARRSDLVAPRPLGAADAGAASGAVARHRTGRVTPPPPLGSISSAVGR
jgi:type IV pilus biogenesis protein CpaD/CtpE